MPSSIQAPLLENLKSTIPDISHGAVYTRPWVAEVILDLAGYTADKNIVDSLAIEPAAGDGVFITKMAERLIASCKRQGRHVLDCKDSIRAYELNSETTDYARKVTKQNLVALGVSSSIATQLINNWIETKDYLKQFDVTLENNQYPDKKLGGEGSDES